MTDKIKDNNYFINLTTQPLHIKGHIQSANVENEKKKSNKNANTLPILWESLNNMNQFDIKKKVEGQKNEL